MVADLRGGAVMSIETQIVRRLVDGGEELTQAAIVMVRDSETGENLEFQCRNIFDFGYVVNPAYPVEPCTTPGGILVRNEAGEWHWDVYFLKGNPDRLPGRKATDFEVRAIEHLYAHPPISTEIRM